MRKPWYTGELVWLPARVNSVWTGLAVTTEAENLSPCILVRMLTGRMRGSVGGFNPAQLSPVRITKIRRVHPCV